MTQAWCRAGLLSISTSARNGENVAYKIQVNGETVWESEGDAVLVHEVSISTPRGESALVRVPPEENYMSIEVREMSVDNHPLVLVDEMKRRAKGDMTSEMASEFGATQDKHLPDPAPEVPEEELTAKLDDSFQRS